MERGLVTKGGYKKIADGHPWLNPTDIVDRTVLPKRPCAFQYAERWWFCSPESFLRLRRIGPNQPKWMHTSSFNTLTNADQFQSYFGHWMLKHFTDTLKNKIVALKLDLSEEDLCLRWIFSENDFFPGLIVDIFGKTVVAQINSAPVETFWLHIRTALVSAYKAVAQEHESLRPNFEPLIVELRNSHIRKKEGLDVIEPNAESATAATSNKQVLKWNGLKWHMTPAGSQKTGAYFDQRENHTHTALLAQEKNLKTAWDLCTYQGGFALHLVKAGLQVTAIDQSATALEQAKQNLELNQLPAASLSLVKADVFEWLKNQVMAGDQADLIVLDPPSFVKSRTEIEPALKGYKELNIAALQSLKPGGLLVSCVCSHYMSEKMYKKILMEAAQQARVAITLHETRGPSADHSPAPGFTEGRYLQAWYAFKNH